MKDNIIDDFSDILIPYTKPKVICELSRELDFHTSKVILKNDDPAYLLISKQCFDHVNSINLFKSIYFQYKCTHPAIMPVLQFSISPKNSFDTYHPFPKNGKLSDYLGFSHEDKINNLKPLTPTQKSIISYGIAHALNYIHKKKLLFNCVNANNIYLDSNFYPLLSNFYSCKKIDDSKCGKKLTKYHLKIDVYAYSIIYAALIEPVHLHPPAKSADDFFNRLKKRERPVLENSTKKQEEILNEMWNWIPRDRPDFNRILEYFDSGDLLFPGTEMKEFECYKKMLNDEKMTVNTISTENEFLSTYSFKNNSFQSRERINNEQQFENESEPKSEIQFNFDAEENKKYVKDEKLNQVTKCTGEAEQKIKHNEDKDEIIVYEERSVKLDFDDENSDNNTDLKFDEQRSEDEEKIQKNSHANSNENLNTESKEENIIINKDLDIKQNFESFNENDKRNESHNNQNLMKESKFESDNLNDNEQNLDIEVEKMNEKKNKQSKRFHYDEQKQLFEQEMVFDKQDQKYYEFKGQFIE